MPDLHKLETAIPVASLKLIDMDSAARLGENVNHHLVTFRKNIKSLAKNDHAFKGYATQSYLLDAACYRFGSGEGKAVISESVRGSDLFILTDVCNHSISYTMNGYTNYKSPDDHYQDLKRIIAAVNGKAHRINVIMPYLYEGRQFRRNCRESLDCSYAIEELSKMGVNNLITFDAHDPRVQNAIPLRGFETVQPIYQFLKYLLKNETDLQIDSSHMMVISPDEGGTGRAVYFANMLGLDMGMFYKRRDYTKIVGGRNPIVAHEFLGSSVEGKTVLIIDDMIASGESMLDTARELKDRKAAKVAVCCTFGLFTNGFEKFDEFYDKGYIDSVVTTNLNYRSPELLHRKWYVEADMSKYIAAIINSLNHDASIGNVLSPTEKIQQLIKKYNADGYDYYQKLF